MASRSDREPQSASKATSFVWILRTPLADYLPRHARGSVQRQKVETRGGHLAAKDESVILEPVPRVAALNLESGSILELMGLLE